MKKKHKVLIAGGTGLIGSRLVNYLSKEKFDINILSRSDYESHDNITYFNWCPDEQTMDVAALEGVSVVVNLAGAGIADARWTEERKRIIIASRVNSAKTLIHHIKDLPKKPDLYFNASAVGYYGDKADEVLTTNNSNGSGFLAEVVRLWEKANNEIGGWVNRQVTLRIGIVLSSKGGALAEIIKPTKAGIYGYFGDGSAYYSWVHIDDICKIIKTSILDNAYNGVYNGTAPNPVTIYELLKTIKQVKNGLGILLPIPKFGLRLIMGEMSEMLFDSTRAIPNNLLELGFEFDYKNLENALTNILIENVG